MLGQCLHFGCTPGILKRWVTNHLHQNHVGAILDPLTWYHWGRALNLHVQQTFQVTLGILLSVEQGHKPYCSLGVRGLACFNAVILGLRMGVLRRVEFCPLKSPPFLVTLFLYLSVPAHLRKRIGDVEIHPSIRPSKVPNMCQVAGV